MLSIRTVRNWSRYPVAGAAAGVASKEMRGDDCRIRSLPLPPNFFMCLGVLGLMRPCVSTKSLCA